jgi:hypothetical protein
MKRKKYRIEIIDMVSGDIGKSKIKWLHLRLRQRINPNAEVTKLDFEVVKQLPLTDTPHLDTESEVLKAVRSY